MGYTPSDFPLVTLTPEQLGKLEATYPELVDVLPLTPLQEGLLFHAVHQDEATGVYLVQFGLELRPARWTRPLCVRPQPICWSGTRTSRPASSIRAWPNRYR